METIIGFLIGMLFVVGFPIGFFVYFTNYRKTKKEYELYQHKYSNIVDVEEEYNRMRNKVDGESAEWNGKKTKIISDYNSAKERYDKLMKEVALLEDINEMHEYGVYSPIFNFDDPDDYKQALDSNYQDQKKCISEDRAIRCFTEWTVNGNKAKGVQKTKKFHTLMLRAFNGECDSCIAKVDWNNVVRMEERIKKAFETINKLGDSNNSKIQKEYLDLRIKELLLTYEYKDKLHEQKEEQKRIREEMREEEKVRKELERQKLEAEKEEAKYMAALEKAREELRNAHGDALSELQGKIDALEESLREAEERKERALSMAQQTKSGHVYVISNIGSFGEHIYKIGMTRRLEPEERVKELSDASVPFAFDIHAMIYSENAPELENQLHNHFDKLRVNRVNRKKEFFKVKLDHIEEWTKKNNYKINFTKVAEARELRETLALIKNEEGIKPEKTMKITPNELNDGVESLFA